MESPTLFTDLTQGAAGVGALVAALVYLYKDMRKMYADMSKAQDDRIDELTHYSKLCEEDRRVLRQEIDELKRNAPTSTRT